MLYDLYNFDIIHYLPKNMTDSGLIVSFGGSSVPLVSLAASYYIDTSGSTTENDICQREKTFSQNLCDHVRADKIFRWDSTSSQVSSISAIVGNRMGGTDPCCFVSLIGKPDCMVIVTDGQIGTGTMDRFKTAMYGKVGTIPIIVILTVPSLDVQINQLAGVDLSISDPFLSLSNDVIIVITSGTTSRTLMSKGCFDIFEVAGLEPTTVVSSLPLFDMSMLKLVCVTGGVPSNLIKLRGIDGYVDLNVLYTLNDIPVSVITGLCDRACIPKMNLDVLHRQLTTMLQHYRQNPELDAIRQELFTIATSSDAGSDRHKELIATYEEVRKRKFTPESSDKVKAITDLLTLIADYKRDSTSIAFGSNRANRAIVFDDSQLMYLGECVRIECPILMSDGDACILLKAPVRPDYISEFTSDYAMEAPFEFGTWLTDLVTPGMYCHNMASNVTQNPYTRESVIGFLPLSTNPSVIMKHMSKLFGGNREMWHFVRGYIAMLTCLYEKDWANKDAIMTCLQGLFLNYNSTLDLKGGSDKVPIKNSFEHVLSNYSTCLRDRTYNDVLTIIKIAKLVMPGFAFSEDRIVGMISVVREFQTLLDLHKSATDMLNHVMTVDNLGHYVSYVGGIKGVIAQLLWNDVNGDYKLLKLQLAIDKSLTDRRFGRLLRCAFNGEPFDDSVLECKLAEPTGVHFGAETYTGPSMFGILPKCVCTFCGATFTTSQEKFLHLRAELGPYFFNGHLAVYHAVSDLGKLASVEDLFRCAKRQLYAMYGSRAKFLHTQRCKTRLLQFIATMTAS